MGFCFLDFKTDFEHNNYPRTVTYIDETLETCLVVPKTVARRRYCMKYFENCTDARDFIATFNCTLVLVNIDVKDSLSVIPMIRKDGIRKPIIFMINDRSEIGKVKAAGADDYIIKPFDTKELIARVKAVLRRYQPARTAAAAAKPTGKYVSYPDLVINLTNYSVEYRGKPVEMPPKELELLYFLASSPNQVFTREQLLDHIWGYEYIGDTRTVDVHVKRLREKLGEHSAWAISTVWGIGYKFEVRN